MFIGYNIQLSQAIVFKAYYYNISDMEAKHTLPLLSSLGHTLNLDKRNFGFLRESNDLLEDGSAMRERFEKDGYLYLKNVLDRDRIMAARRSILERLAIDGILDLENHDLMDGVVDPAQLECVISETSPELPNAQQLKQLKSNAFRPDIAVANSEVEEIVFGETIQSFYDTLFGEPAKHFDYIWLRVMGPGKGTPTHCDWVFMSRGSENLRTCWVPYGIIPLQVGGLILLEDSHKHAERIADYLNKDVDEYCENVPADVKKVAIDGGWSFNGWLSESPHTLPDAFGSRWLTSPLWEPGDFITFNMKMIHGSLDNRSDRVRISTDVRYQPGSEPADERWIGANPTGHSTAGKRGRIC